MVEPPPTKRRRMSDSEDEDLGRRPASLTQPISPPRKRRNVTPGDSAIKPTPGSPQEPSSRALLPSPFKLTTIRDLPTESNVDAVGLGDILGDPLITECWEFNYLHDLDFLMGHFDDDTKSLVKIHVVHGFWKREDPNRLWLQEQASTYNNVTLHTAYMPEMFGTHHSKMMILFRNDDTAKVVIHTANMIAKDWTNMTNGVWQTPLLPLSKNPNPQPTETRAGSGGKFKTDLLSYLRAYNAKREVCKSLVNKLAKFDFSAVRGTLVASVPGKHDIEDQSSSATRWGWVAIKDALRSVPIQQGKSEVVVQISSIATLGPSDNWLQRTLFDSLSSSSATVPTTRPNFKVVFPTPDEIRQSLDGYKSGGSIHTKIQSAQQAKQLQYLKPMFCHWANDSADGISGKGDVQDAGRQRAAPHIKTYIRYGEKSIDWALLTSANVSKQAWGEAANASREIRIASWEVGVLVWPELLADDKQAKMVGTFKMDLPSKHNIEGSEPLVGLRIPYNLPLQRYGKNEIPWVATADYTEPDWLGRTW